MRAHNAGERALSCSLNGLLRGEWGVGGHRNARRQGWYGGVYGAQRFRNMKLAKERATSRALTGLYHYHYTIFKRQRTRTTNMFWHYARF